MSKIEPFVSVIIPIYNGEKDIPPLIECLKNQTYNPQKVEFILVDNNSSDLTFKLIQEKIQPLENITIKPIQEQEIQSSYAARNRGIKEAQGEIIAFTDVDCRPQKDWLEKLVQPFSDPNTMIVAGEIKAVQGDNILEKYADKREILSQKYTLANEFSPYGQTANLALRKEALKVVGLFRPYLTTGGDADICWRILKEIESEIKFVPDALVLHRHRDNLKDFQSQWRRYGKSAKYLHQLHGSNLMPNYSTSKYSYRLLVWFIKEFPKNTLKLLMGKGNFVDLIQTPLDMMVGRLRSNAQKKASLPEKAEHIERL
ncbi:glycosyltransferase [Cyanobacterium stanieri LEGE 03274]|uniref:Glycosyltransferase n=1 Tax=Cyanobacterium stanieri LEGE 03274 TaxID=1828756 RepID=A0ABR9V2A6_9CHRO|nr:glycosyltransferase [Cyanobacterium stanieri]MBE9222027.1 glycosyltransferase [Cyanobacterium stanieri LEGE 03274]